MAGTNKSTDGGSDTGHDQHTGKNDHDADPQNNGGDCMAPTNKSTNNKSDNGNISAADHEQNNEKSVDDANSQNNGGDCVAHSNKSTNGEEKKGNGNVRCTDKRDAYPPTAKKTAKKTAKRIPKPTNLTNVYSLRSRHVHQKK